MHPFPSADIKSLRAQLSAQAGEILGLREALEFERRTGCENLGGEPKDWCGTQDITNCGGGAVQHEPSHERRTKPMAGSLNHIVEEDGSFTMDHLDHMGDAHEALEECHQIIAWLLPYAGRALDTSDATGALTECLHQLGYPMARTPVLYALERTENKP